MQWNKNCKKKNLIEIQAKIQFGITEASVIIAEQSGSNLDLKSE